MNRLASTGNTLLAKIASRKVAREIGGGQSHFVEVIVVVLIVVVIGIFVYTVGVPSIEKLWTNAMSLIGTIKPK